MKALLHPFVVQLGFILLKVVCLLVAIAYYTIAERKIMAAIQRRRGPNVVGFWGLLQPLADGLKLVAKEMVIPSHSNSRIFVAAPLVILTLSLISWSIIPFGCKDSSSEVAFVGWEFIVAAGCLTVAWYVRKLEQDALKKEWKEGMVSFFEKHLGNPPEPYLSRKECIVDVGKILSKLRVSKHSNKEIRESIKRLQESAQNPEDATFTNNDYKILQLNKLGKVIDGEVYKLHWRGPALTQEWEQKILKAYSNLNDGKLPKASGNITNLDVNLLRRDLGIEHNTAENWVAAHKVLKLMRPPHWTNLTEKEYYEILKLDRFENQTLTEYHQALLEAKLAALPSPTPAPGTKSGFDGVEEWTTSDVHYGILITLGVTFLVVYENIKFGRGVHWKYAFLGKVRSVFQVLSYEAVTMLAMLLVVLATTFVYGLPVESPVGAKALVGGEDGWIIFLACLFSAGCVIWCFRGDETKKSSTKHLYPDKWYNDKRPRIKPGKDSGFDGFEELTESSRISDVHYGILIILALSSLTVYGLIIAGWASNSKYAFLGALRSAAQMISYEVAISLVLLPVILMSGSLNFAEIVNAQALTVWFLFPLLPISIIFFISMIAETNRTPFDLPEAEAELVAGYNVEYSSIIFAMFFLAEYGNMIMMSLLKALLFLGGWSFWAPLPQPLVLTLKGLIFCFLFVLVRATFPRYRYDQLMDIGWKIFLPLSTGYLLFVVGILMYFEALPVVNEVAGEVYSEA